MSTVLNFHTLNLTALATDFSDPDTARNLLERVRWPQGPVCHHCGEVNNAKRLMPRPDSKSPVRKGVWKCNGCHEQFTVTTGTVMEDSHLPLNKWLLAFHLMMSSKKGMSAHQLHRMLGTTYRTAWFVAHRVRHAIGEHPTEPLTKLHGTVEMDETYIGGKPRKPAYPGGPKMVSPKIPVFSLVERGGRVRSFHVPRVTEGNLLPVIKRHVARNTAVMTDDFASYVNVRFLYPMHSTINHSRGIYSRPGTWGRVHTNTIEGYFSILKRGIIGVFHHVSEQHLFRYLAEFDFRYSARKMKDGERTLAALQTIEGKRLTLREPRNGADVF
jgi:transposase-like protein